MKKRSLGVVGIVLSMFIAGLGCESTDDDGGNTGTDTTKADTAQADTAADTNAAETGGAVHLTFSAANGVKKSPNLKEPLQGTVYGALWKSEDVAVLGPIDGAEDVGGVEVANVDATGEEPSVANWTSESLPPGEYIFLGFFDVDGNGAESKSPDPGDPVTLPFTNKFVRSGR